MYLIIYYLPPLSIQSVYEICPKIIISVLVSPAVLCNKDILCQMNVFDMPKTISEPQDALWDISHLNVETNDYNDTDFLQD